MSTKIYDAYRLKLSDQMWQLAKEWRPIAHANVLKKIRNDHKQLIDAMGADSPKLLQALEKMRGWEAVAHQIAARSMVAGEFMREVYRESQRLKQISDYEYDTSISFREDRGRVYVQLYCDDTYDCLDFIRKDRRITDFHYQDSTDRPKHISEQAWEKRRNAWDRMYRGDGRLMNLSVTIMDYDEFSLRLHIMESELCDRLREDKDPWTLGPLSTHPLATRESQKESQKQA